MPPKALYSRDDIVSAAFELVRKGGFGELSARRIGEELRSSTAPVYSSFSSMDELKDEVLKMGEALLLKYTMTDYTRSVFLNMGAGYLLFAQENRELFRALFLETGEMRGFYEKLHNALDSELDRDELVSLLPRKERKEVVNRMSIYMHGYASLLCVGLIDDLTKKGAISAMYSMGKDVIDSALEKAGITERYSG